MARPRKEIDKAQFEKLCGLQCTQADICRWFDVTDKTLTAWCRRTYGKGFSEVFAEKRLKGTVSLRATAFRKAEDNAAVLIFLLKNMCGMSDHPNRVEYEDETVDPLTQSLRELGESL